MSVDYSPVLVAVLFGVGFAVLFTMLAMVLGPKHVSAEKLSTFECGSEPIGSPRVRFSVKFYQVAILFVVFDIETAFLYPWVVTYRRLSCAGALEGTLCHGPITFFGFSEMVVFMAVLVVALAYVWRKRAIGWG
jgi:NADH-quinone oxidoreductase subunit A